MVDLFLEGHRVPEEAIDPVPEEAIHLPRTYPGTDEKYREHWREVHCIGGINHRTFEVQVL